MLLLNDPAQTALTFGFAFLMGYFLMKVGFTDSTYVAGIAAVSAIMAGVTCGVMVDSIYGEPPKARSPEQSTSM
jgi:hypothetical protein